MITICKTILSGTAPGQIRDQTSGLASAPLRDLAVKLAADPDLTVSVITYSDGRQELEVLHTGPPHHTEDTVRPPQLYPPGPSDTGLDAVHQHSGRPAGRCHGDPHRPERRRPLTGPA